MGIIDYNNLTEEQIEEWVEDIDWSLVPFELITPYIIEQFKTNQELNLRLEFEKKISNLELFTMKKYPGYFFFFSNEIFLDFSYNSKDQIIYFNKYGYIYGLEGVSSDIMCLRLKILFCKYLQRNYSNKIKGLENFLNFSEGDNIVNNYLSAEQELEVLIAYKDSQIVKKILKMQEFSPYIFRKGSET